MFQMRATIPDRIFPRLFERAIKEMASRTAEDIRADFELTAASPPFEKPVKFNKRGAIIGSEVVISVTTRDENYLRLNEGIPFTYKIPQDGPRLLVFREGYKAKTDPDRLRRGILKPTPGGPQGDLVFRYTQITARGFPARNFGEAIRKKWEKPIKARLFVTLWAPFIPHICPKQKKGLDRARREARKTRRP